MNNEVNMKSKQTQQCKLDILLDQFLTDKTFFLIEYLFLFRNAYDYAIKMGYKLAHADMFMLSLKMWAKGCECAFIK